MKLKYIQPYQTFYSKGMAIDIVHRFFCCLNSMTAPDTSFMLLTRADIVAVTESRPPYQGKLEHLHPQQINKDSPTPRSLYNHRFHFK